MHFPLLQAISHSHAIRQIVVALGIILVLGLTAVYMALLSKGQHAANGKDATGHGLGNSTLDRFMNCVGRLLQPASAVELQNQGIFWFAALIGLAGVMAAVAVIPFGPFLQLADVDIGVLFVVAASGLSVYGILLGTRFTDNSSTISGNLLQCARFLSYQTAACLALVPALILGGSLSIRSLVEAQDQTGSWFAFPVFVGFCLYFVAGAGVMDRAPHELEGAESARDSGNSVEMDGFRWLVYLLSECIGTIVFACIAVIVFWGGWLRPLASFHDHIYGTSIEFLDAIPAALSLVAGFYCLENRRTRNAKTRTWAFLEYGGCFACAVVMAALLLLPAALMAAVHGMFWFLLKLALYLYATMWFRATFPRSRFDELMNFGWRFLLPLALVNVFLVAAAQLARQQYGWNALLAFGLASVLMLVMAVSLALDDDQAREQADLLPPPVEVGAEELVNQ